METGSVVTNVSLSIGLAFFAAFVDYDHGMLWVIGTPNNRGVNRTDCFSYMVLHILGERRGSWHRFTLGGGEIWAPGEDQVTKCG